jgi:hypothetical protein
LVRDIETAERRAAEKGRGLTIEVTRAKERIDAARSAGVNATKARRALACLDQELADAKKRMIEEFHRVPSNPYA